MQTPYWRLVWQAGHAHSLQSEQAADQGRRAQHSMRGEFSGSSLGGLCSKGGTSMRVPVARGTASGRPRDLPFRRFFRCSSNTTGTMVTSAAGLDTKDLLGARNRIQVQQSCRKLSALRS